MLLFLFPFFLLQREISYISKCHIIETYPPLHFYGNYKKASADPLFPQIIVTFLDVLSLVKNNLLRSRSAHWAAMEKRILVFPQCSIYTVGTHTENMKTHFDLTIYILIYIDIASLTSVSIPLRLIEILV